MYVVHIVLFSIKGFLLCVCGTYSSVFCYVYVVHIVLFSIKGFLLKVFCYVYVVHIVLFSIKGFLLCVVGHIVLFSIKGFLLCVCGTYSSLFFNLWFWFICPGTYNFLCFAVAFNKNSIDFYIIKEFVEFLFVFFN